MCSMSTISTNTTPATITLNTISSSIAIIISTNLGKNLDPGSGEIQLSATVIGQDHPLGTSKIGSYKL